MISTYSAQNNDFRGLGMARIVPGRIHIVQNSLLTFDRAYLTIRPGDIRRGFRSTLVVTPTLP